MSLADRLLARFKESEPLALAAVERRCLRSRLQSCDCRRCADLCPREAITTEEGGVRLDAKKCTGCLACLAVCPAEALQGHDQRLAAWHEKSGGEGALRLCCEKGISGGEEIVLPCLGAVSAEELAALAIGQGREIKLILSKCGQCRSPFLPELIGKRLVELDERLAPFFPSSLIHLLVIEGSSGQAASASRRAFFKAFTQISLQAAAETMNALKDAGEAGPRQAHKHVPARLTFLAGAIAEADEAGKETLLRLFYSLAVGEDCNFCGACAGICPTGALKNVREEERKSLEFAWAKCGGCGLCAAFCRKQAMNLSPGRSLAASGEEFAVLRETRLE